jgi:L-ascorbate metabolism protein UlaG (beta-lactamase superfamily)
MKNSEVRIQYIYHSGFIVETAQNILVFDYYQGTVKLTNESKKKIFVFSSHGHPDHFTPQIFDWQKERPDIHYILSSDISIRQKNDNIKLLSPYEETAIDNVRISTFGSTDLGVSFLVSCDGINVFHAGDLNWWYWWGESPEEIANAEKCFKEEIAKIKGIDIDLAFFPVDPRLEHNDRVGADYFVKEITPKVLIPMHFADNPAAAENYASSMKHSPTKIVALTKRGQEILLFG